MIKLKKKIRRQKVNRNEYQGYFMGGKGGRCVRLTSLPPLCADCLEIWEPQPPGTLGSVQTCNGIALPVNRWLFKAAGCCRVLSVPYPSYYRAMFTNPFNFFYILRNPYLLKYLQVRGSQQRWSFLSARGFVAIPNEHRHNTATYNRKYELTKTERRGIW